MNGDPEKVANRSEAVERPLIDAAWAQFETLARHKSTSTDPLRSFSVPGYRVLREIHRGGQGVVYQALQESTRRKVAIKVLKGGPLADESELARFDREVDVLSRLNHPHIVAIHDRGLTAGHAYYVMDYIPGRSLDAYVAGAGLSLREILNLCRKVCEAVNTAHLRGVIHRDLKPSNIRIDEEGEPRILDFGLAKMAPDASWSAAAMTVTGQFVGSLPWASPEQAEGRSDLLDIRTDVYSLGVILYQLLTGSFPYLVSGPMNDVVRSIIHASPARPSTFAPNIDRDVEIILLKCLAKEPERRYQSAGELARDIQRYLDGEPIEARPATSLYQLRQFTRRNKALVTSVIAVIFIFAVATTVSVAFAFREAAARTRESLALGREVEQRERADREAVQTRAVADFQAQMLADIDPKAMGLKLRSDLLAKAQAAGERSGQTTKDIEGRVEDLEKHLAGIDLTGLALTALDENVFQRALAAIDSKFADQPVVKAQLLQTLATTVQSLGLLDRAHGPQTEALAIRRRVLGDEHRDTLSSISRMGHLLRAQGKLDQAEPYYREALDKYRRVLGDDHPHTLQSINNMGFLLQEKGKLDQAEPYYRETLEKRRRVLGDEHPDTLHSINNMGYLLSAQGKLDQAEPYWRDSLEKYRRVLGDEHPDTVRSINNIGFLLQAQGKLAEAELYWREALEKYRRVLGDEHPDTLRSIYNMGYLLQAQGKLDQAEPYYREALEKRRRVLGGEHPDTLISINNMGALLQAQGKIDQAEPYYREALEKRRRLLGDKHPHTLTSIGSMGALLHAQSKPAEALELLAPAQEAARQAFTGSNAVRLGRFLATLGRARAAAGEFDAAKANLNEAYAILNEAKGATQRDQTDVLNGLVEFYDARHSAEPDKGYDAKATEWRSKLTEQRANAERE